MKKIAAVNFVWYYIVFVTALSCTQVDKDIHYTSGNYILFNKEWKFIIDTVGVLEPSLLSESFKDTDWDQVNLPHTPRIEPLIVNDQWQGDCWYKKSIEFKSDWRDKQLFLRFEGAMNVAEVWINETKKISHLGGYLPFVIDITEDLKEDHLNTITLKLNNEDNPVTGPKPLKDLDFNTYGGIYRDVFLQVKDKIHITDEQFAAVKAGGGIFVSFPLVDEDSAMISVKTHVKNESDLAEKVIIKQTLKKGEVIKAFTEKEISLDSGEDKHFQQSLFIENPELWSPQNPTLYSLETTLIKGDEILETKNTRIGIRKFKLLNNKLYLNGKQIFLRGINRHQEYPFIGYAISRNADYRDAYKIKSAGFDYVRLSHYPHSKYFLDACDELGIVVLDAILGWQYYSEDEAFRQQVFQTARDMIRRDRNHPSILAWEVSLNESWMPEEFIDTLIKISNEEFPYENSYTAGWQSYGYDIYLQARQHRVGHNPNKFPDKPYIVSEYGDWEYYAMNAGLTQHEWSNLLPEERSSRQPLGSGEKRLLQQARNIQEAHNDNFNTPAIADGYWVMFDYNRGYANDLELSGIMSIFRLPKFSYFFYKSQRNAYEQMGSETNPPMVFIADHMRESQEKDIRIFSNCQEVELLLNDQSVGKQKPDTDRYSTNLNHPPFTFKNVENTTGNLIALGYLDGEVVAQHEIQSPGEPVKIIIEADYSGKPWNSGCNDAIFVHAKVVDANNQVVYKFKDKINFNVKGNAQIVGDKVSKPEAGIASILVMAGDSAAEIEITAHVGNLKSEPFQVVTEPIIE